MNEFSYGGRGMNPSIGFNESMGGVQRQSAQSQDAEDAARAARVKEMQDKIGYLGFTSANTGIDGNLGNTGMSLDQFVSAAQKQGFKGAEGYSGNLGNPGSRNLGMGQSMDSPNVSGLTSLPNTPNASGGQNPYISQMAQGITSQMNENWNRNLAPSIRSGAMAAGGFGGSRQGVVEANGLNDLNRTLGQSLSSLYGQDWTNSQNRNLQQQQINNQNDQFGRNLSQQDKQFGLNLDSNNAQFGANLGLQTMNSQNQWAMNGVNAANQIQQQPINYFNGFNNNTNTAAGQGGTSTGTGTQGTSSDPFLTSLGYSQLNSGYKSTGGQSNFNPFSS